jgi:ferrous iron transport protein A
MMSFSERKEKMMPLTLADVGEENTIKKIGGNAEVKMHLENLGFQVGGSVSIINTINGNVIVKVKESRIAIGEDMARKIMI